MTLSRARTATRRSWTRPSPADSGRRLAFHEADHVQRQPFVELAGDPHRYPIPGRCLPPGPRLPDAAGEAAGLDSDCADRLVGAKSGRSEALPAPEAGEVTASPLGSPCTSLVAVRAFRDGPRLAASEVRGRHRIPVIARRHHRDAPRAGVIRRTGTTPGGMASRRRRVDKSAGEPRVRTPLTARSLA